MKQGLMVGAALAGLLAAAPAYAVDLRGGLGGAAGYGELALGRNDDQSSSQLNLPFSLNFFGQTYSTFWVNNNGNITFRGPLGTFTPDAFPNNLQPMIAPYWGDVDTSCAACGEVYVGASRINLPAGTPGNDAVTVTWNNVGYFPSNPSKTNNFQLTLVDRQSTGAGNFDIEFRYNRLEWTTGGASGGSNGLGGTPAQAGYDAGNNTNFFTLPGSRTADVLLLDDLSNVSNEAADRGLWVFNIRGGAIANGSTAGTPLVPTVVNPSTGAFEFDFNVELNQRVFIDPLVAVGYRFEVEPGSPLITSAEFASALVDADGYQIYALDDITLLGQVAVGGTFSFLSALSGFIVRGIDPANALDPTNALAFVTGLTFDRAGQVAISQTPISINVDGAIPEPATWATMMLGFGLIGMTARRRRPAAATL